MYLSYSGYKTASCLYAYWHQYINRTQFTDYADDRLSSIFGSSVGVVFERFYADCMWSLGKGCRPALLGMVPNVVAKALKDAVTPSKFRPAGVLNWKSDKFPKAKYSNPDEIIVDVQSHVHKGIASIQFHRLFGSDHFAEMKLDCDIGSHRIGGRADFVYRDKKRGLVILDGKGTEYASRLDATQLFWYSMLYQAKFKELPSMVGFLLWRAAPLDSVQWFEVTPGAVTSLMQGVLNKADDIEKRTEQAPAGTSFEKTSQVFEKNPSEDNCAFCTLAKVGVCSEGARYCKDLL